MKRRTLRFALLITMSVMLLGMFPTDAPAYFDRGPVTVDVGQSAVTVKEGENMTVTVKVTPDSDSQLPGCGMAECPQTCGDKNCLNDEGECMCNGLEYKTYYADVKTATSDAGIAAVSHKSGVISIKGVAPGEAAITVTGMLRQYREDSRTIQVTVTAKADAAAQQSPAVDGEPDGKPVVKPVDPAPADVQEPADNVPAAEKPSINEPAGGGPGGGTPPQSPDTAQQNADGGIRTVMSNHGPILFVPIRETALMGKAQLGQVMGQQSSVTFEKKDEADNVLYSWSFDGQSVTAPADIDMTVHVSQQGTAELQKVTNGKTALYLAFSHEGPLPGAATLYLRVNNIFANGTKLNLYYFDEQNGEAQLQAESLLVENGCVSIPLQHCSQYILTEDSLDSAGGMTLIWGVIAAVVAVSLVIVLQVVKTKRGQKAV